VLTVNVIIGRKPRLVGWSALLTIIVEKACNNPNLFSFDSSD
jgi:hypothetical protein